MSRFGVFSAVVEWAGVSNDERTASGVFKGFRFGHVRCAFPFHHFVRFEVS
jgi:hypothetical protein